MSSSDKAVTRARELRATTEPRVFEIARLMSKGAWHPPQSHLERAEEWGVTVDRMFTADAELGNWEGLAAWSSAEREGFSFRK